MGEIWAFLSDADNQKTIAWFAGGAAAVVSALWTAFLTLRKKPDAPKPPPAPTKQATARDGVAATGNVDIGGNVNVTHTQLPRGAVVLGLAGCALIALGFLRAGDTTCVAGSVSAGGNVNAGDITITANDTDVDC